MNELTWSGLDDEWFVSLASDILRYNGYVIRYQGDGPDGGVDLFATQPILFGFDIQPFTWAVQCKFSKKPNAAVNDKEIRDVEGILRSSRVKSQNPRGYLLVTNRRIAQNVIERLRGINDESLFKTCAIDGNRLTSLVSSNGDLIQKYFTDPMQRAVPSAQVQNIRWDPSKMALDPLLTVELHSPSRPSKVIKCDAIIDTGAKVSVVPKHIADELDDGLSSRVLIGGVGGNSPVTSHNLCVNIGSIKLSPRQFVSVEGFKVCLLGENVYRDLCFLWDGPNAHLRVWPGTQRK